MDCAREKHGAELIFGGCRQGAHSVGWNEKDDGGVPGKTVTEGDWVWP